MFVGVVAGVGRSVALSVTVTKVAFVGRDRSSERQRRGDVGDVDRVGLGVAARVPVVDGHRDDIDAVVDDLEVGDIADPARIKRSVLGNGPSVGQRVVVRWRGRVLAGSVAEPVTVTTSPSLAATGPVSVSVGATLATLIVWVSVSEPVSPSLTVIVTT